MTGPNNGKVKLTTEPEVKLTAEPEAQRVVEAVRLAVLDLLASLPARPQRLRVRAADVTVDLDWRRLPTPAPVAEHAAPPGPAAEPSGESPEPVAAGGEAVLHHVCAPIVGTFYHSPEPGAAPFAPVGTVVGPGQQVGIVEAMKLMLSVEADRAGRVVEVLVDDGQSVEYGQQLVALAPADSTGT
jgi:acetyl-CoA carboxylase biotin carboxyl carrier protein